MTPTLLTLVVLLAMSYIVMANPSPKIDKLDVNETTTTVPHSADQNQTDDGMQGDQLVAQHYVRTSDGSGSSRYKIRTLVPGKQYMISAVTGEQDPKLKKPVHSSNYLGHRPEFAHYRPVEKEFPWCGNPYYCSDGGNICMSNHCLQGAFCCRTNVGLCCFRSNSGTVKRQVHTTALNVHKKRVDYSVNITPKPVDAYTRPAPTGVESANVPQSPYKPPVTGDATHYNVYDLQPVAGPRVPQPAYIPQPTQTGNYVPLRTHPTSPYQANEITAEEKAVDNSLIHPLFGKVAIESEDEESEQVLNRITGVHFVPEYSQPPTAAYPGVPLHPSAYATPTIPQPYPGSLPQILVPVYPNQRYPRSHYLQDQPYSSIQQISYPSQVFHPAEPSFLLHTHHSKRETPAPYADLQQVYYPSQVFYPATYSNTHAKREVGDLYPQIYYPTNPFYPLEYRSKRGIPDHQEIYYPSQTYYPVRSSRRSAYWEAPY